MWYYVLEVKTIKVILFDEADHVFDERGTILR